MAKNPLSDPMAASLETAIKAADWLHGEDRYAAGIELARLLAGQIDTLVASQDPAAVREMNIRTVKNYHAALHALGLTPEGYARMTGVGGRAATGPVGQQGDEDDDAAQKAEEKAEETGNPLDLLTAEVENVVSMAGRKKS